MTRTVLILIVFSCYLVFLAADLNLSSMSMMIGVDMMSLISTTSAGQSITSDNISLPTKLSETTPNTSPETDFTIQTTSLSSLVTTVTDSVLKTLVLITEITRTLVTTSTRSTITVTTSVEADSTIQRTSTEILTTIIFNTNVTTIDQTSILVTGSTLLTITQLQFVTKTITDLPSEILTKI